MQRSGRSATMRAVLLGTAALLMSACVASSDASSASSSALSAPSGSDSLIAGFCTAWSRYAATLSAVTVDPSASTEMLAAPSLIAAADSIGANWPPDLVSERSVVLTDLIGPYSRRAQKALEALTAAGATRADIDELRVAWAHSGAVPVRLGPLVAAAANAFGAMVTPFVDDPSLGDRAALIDPVRAPVTEAFLVAHCPDVDTMLPAVRF